MPGESSCQITMIPRNQIPDFRFSWFHLACECEFATSTEAIGHAGRSERKTEHDGYRVAWFDQKYLNLTSDEFRIPIDVDEVLIETRLRKSVTPRVVEVYGNCFWELPDESYRTTDIWCAGCNQSFLKIVEDDSPDLQYKLHPS